MKNAIILATLCVWMTSLSGLAQTTAFTYQGKLNDGGAPASGNYDLTFTLFDAEDGGNAIAALTNSIADITNGLFTALLDYGPGVFTGSNYWIEVAVRTNGGTFFNALLPRHPITPVPYALHATTAAHAATAAVADMVLSVPTTNLAGTIADTQLSTNVALLDGSPTFAGTVMAADFIGGGAGLTNVPGTLSWRFVSETNQPTAVNCGYVFTNSLPVAFSLPVSANLGDVVHLCSAGPGGWRISQTTGQSIRSSKGLFSMVWTNCLMNKAWSSVACSADGSRVVVAANDSGGSPGNLFVSADSGLTWRLTNGFAYALGVSMSADGLKIAVGSSQATGILVSTDYGVSWLYKSVGSSPRWTAMSADGSKLFLATSSWVFYSPNLGADWIARTSNPNPGNAGSIVCSTDGFVVMAVAGGTLYVSSNSGVNWTSRGSGFSSIACSSDGSKIIAGSSSGSIRTSIDGGVTWTVQNSGNADWRAVASSADGMTLAAAAYGGSVHTSIDGGLTWEKQNSGDRNWNALALSADGTKLFAAVYSGQVYTGQRVARLSTTVGPAGYLIGPPNSTIGLLCVGAGKWTIINSTGDVFAY